MDYLFCLTNAAKQLAGLRSKGALPYEKLRISGRDIKHCRWVNHSAFITEQNPKLRLANMYGLFQHRIEDWLQLTRRRADDSQHLRRCCLLLKRFAQLARALLLSLEQAHIFDRDDGLVGKCRNQFDVLVVERPHHAT